MGPSDPDKRASRVSRETRRLLATVLLSLAALWILARIRFPERPPTPNPVAPVLSQLSPRAAFDDLARSVQEVQPDLAPALGVLSLVPDGTGPGQSRRDAVASLRFREDAVLALAYPGARPAHPAAAPAARDAATGLLVLRTTASADAPLLSSWTPARAMEYPRYLIASGVVGEQVYLRPVFFGPLLPLRSPAWDAEVWSVPPHLDLRAGTALFSTSGNLVGVVGAAAGGVVLVPAAVVIAAAERLLAHGSRRPAWLGVGVQPLGEALRAATGVAAGVAVTWVDPNGPAARQLFATDVVLSLGGEVVSGPAEWDARLARVPAGERVPLRVRRGGEDRELTLTAAMPPAAAPAARLGLSLRRTRYGAEVTAVEEGSLATSAGIQEGDVLTRVGAAAGPTPAQVRRAFADARGAAVLVAVTRGSDHLVVAVGGQ